MRASDTEIYVYSILAIKNKIMKIRLFAAAAAAFVLASCAPKPGDVTKIAGVVNDAEVTEVNLRISGIDTTLAVVDGKFYLELPADVTAYGLVMSTNRQYGAYFISDGTQMEMTFADQELSIKTEPEYVQTAYDKYAVRYSDIYKSESETKDADLEALWFETVKADPDNVVSTLVVSDAMYDLAPEKMLELVALIQDPIRNGKFVSKREAEAKAQLNTKPGMKYTDFTVEHVYGYDRSMDPQPLKKEVKFSDYVGKGTYVLVDFWSPWCGPCKREIPNIKKVYEQYKDKGFEVLSIAVWERKPQSHTIETAAELGMDWKHINNAQQIPTDIYGIGGIPHLMLIGPDGTILERGFHGLEGIEAAVSKYIK